MAKSARLPDPAFAAFAEDTVLCELNADFKRSKRELIDRFLHDQEELNRRFEEYELHSSDEDPAGQGKALYRKGLEAVETRTVSRLDREQAQTEEAVPDNLSTASAVHTSSVESIPDVIDLEIEENLEGCYGDEPDENVPWNGTTRKRDKTKFKKQLVKKNVRPKTSMGIRKSCGQMQTEDGEVCMNPNSQPEHLVPGPSVPEVLSMSMAMSTPRSRTASWIAASTPATQMSNPMAARPLYLNNRPQSRARDSYLASGVRQSESRLSSATRPEFEPSVSTSGMRPLPTGTRLSRDVNYVPLNGRRDSSGRDGARRDPSGRLTLTFNSPITSGALGIRSHGRPRNDTRMSRDMYTSEAKVGPIKTYSNLTKNSSTKRQIAVLKLPPLEGAVVNKPLAEPPTLMTSSVKGTTMHSATEFITG